jgi:hypothetical protein
MCITADRRSMLARRRLFSSPSLVFATPAISRGVPLTSLGTSLGDHQDGLRLRTMQLSRTLMNCSKIGHSSSGRARSSQSPNNAASSSGRSCMSAWPASSMTARVACG